MDEIKQIHDITGEIINSIVDQGPGRYEPVGQYYTFDDGVWVACDNSCGNAWVEEFKTEKEAIQWLKEGLE